MRCKKKWQVSLSYEVNRLSASNLSDTYEKLLPRRQYKTDYRKEIELNIEKQYYLKQLEGSPK